MAINILRLSKAEPNVFGSIKLEGSKSISNRALIIRALTEEKFSINNLSPSEDTSVLIKALSENSDEINVGHAGTSFRFLTAYLSLTNKSTLLTGSDRMKERPIGPLVDALNSLGANIAYAEKEGFPPLKIKASNREWKSEVTMPASISSQYISALCLIAPRLKNGLIINLEGDLVSRPYIQMTLDIMSHFGIESEFQESQIIIKNQAYQAKEITIEGDWSAASYYYSLCALAEKAEIKISGLFENSWQGDSVIQTIGKKIGIESSFIEGELVLTKNAESKTGLLEYDFLESPDLAQTVMVICGGLGIQGLFSGLQTLKIKETDRIEAVKKEISKFGVSLSALPTKKFAKNSGTEYYMLQGKTEMRSDVIIETYKDHRMAMAFAPLALINSMQFENPDVVKKSYPNFWKDLESLGFEIS